MPRCVHAASRREDQATQARRREREAAWGEASLSLMTRPPGPLYTINTRLPEPAEPQPNLSWLSALCWF